MCVVYLHKYMNICTCMWGLFMHLCKCLGQDSTGHLGAEVIGVLKMLGLCYVDEGI